MKKTVLLVFLLSLAALTQGQKLVKVKTNLKGVMAPVAGWLDVSGSKHMGVWVSGEYFVNNKHVITSSMNRYKDTDHFTYIKSSLPAIYLGSSASADYDGDGDLDIVVTGLNQYNTPVMRLYNNAGHYRYKIDNQIFDPVIEGSVTWGDFDHDRDFDILATGKDANNKLTTTIYNNNDGTFEELVTGVPGVYYGNADWGDFDDDGKLDILITGDVGGHPYTAVYMYRQRKYIKLNQNFLPLKHSYGRWGDLNSDGNLDFIVSGEDENGYPTCIIYSNKKGFFTEVPTVIRGLKNCYIDLADYDHDGDLDIAMCGESLERSYSYVYENLGGFRFKDIHAGLPGVASGKVKWGDYDGDGDYDLLLAGVTICYKFIAEVYKNTINPIIKKETPSSLFNEAVTPDVDLGPYYYYVFSSCYCDPTGGNNKAYHLYISNIHKEKRKYHLTYTYNNLLMKQVVNWPHADRGHRLSNGFETYKEAEESRKQIIESYQSTHYIIHYINW